VADPKAPEKGRIVVLSTYPTIIIVVTDPEGLHMAVHTTAGQHLFADITGGVVAKAATPGVRGKAA
jgi:hypothetical protein